MAIITDHNKHVLTCRNGNEDPWEDGWLGSTTAAPQESLAAREQRIAIRQNGPNCYTTVHPPQRASSITKYESDPKFERR
jgi:hypothetical protein